MASFHQLYYHIVIVVYKREKVFTIKNEEKLFDYMKELAANKNSLIETINAAENHIHILLRLHPSIALADMVRELKVWSNRFIKEHKLFPKFKKWQTGYGAFSVSKSRRSIVSNYIKKQKEHHKVKSFETEFIETLIANEISFNPLNPFGDGVGFPDG